MQNVCWGIRNFDRYTNATFIFFLNCLFFPCLAGRFHNFELTQNIKEKDEIAYIEKYIFRNKNRYSVQINVPIKLNSIM
jgi:hypothetical protein